MCRYKMEKGGGRVTVHGGTAIFGSGGSILKWVVLSV